MTEGAERARLAAADVRLVLDALPRAIVVADEENVIVACNAVAERLYGLRADEVVGRSAFDVLTPPHLREAAEKIVAAALAGDSWSGDVRIRDTSGGTVTTWAYIGPLRDADGTIVGTLSAADDVAALSVLEQQTRQLTDHLLLALGAGRLGTWRWDAATGETVWDDVTHRLFGLEPGSFAGTFEAWVELLHPDDRDAVMGAVERAVTERSDYVVEHRVVHPDGTVRWIEGRGKALLGRGGAVAGTIGVSHDITDRKLSEIEAARRVAEAEAHATRERLQRERLEFLSRLNDVALGAVDHVALMEGVAQAAVPELGDWCAVHFVPEPGAPREVVVAHADPERLAWAKELQARLPRSDDLPYGAPAVIRSGTPEFLPEITESQLAEWATSIADVPEAELRAILDALALTSSIIVPLSTARGTVGAMQFISAESGRRYDEADLALAEAAAGRVAAALDTMWLTEQQRTIAATLQSALLPSRLPTIDGVDLTVRYWAAGLASEVGGDFYDAFAIDDGRWAVVIGDVCGTGPHAAAITSVARHTIRAAATHGAAPDEVLRWLNDAILAADGELFCTALYSVIERGGDGRWRYTSVSGGHPLPQLVTAGGEVRTVGEPGTLLGVLPSTTSVVAETVLEPGDTLVLHTDGVTDVRPPYELDPDDVRRLVGEAARGARHADEVADRLGEEVQRILPIPDRHDDVALVVLRIEPT